MLDFYRSSFFWQSDQLGTKYQFSEWNIILQPKEHGSLGIQVPEMKKKLYVIFAGFDKGWVQ
jgi:hypothetical protein